MKQTLLICFSLIFITYNSFSKARADSTELELQLTGGSLYGTLLNPQGNAEIAAVIIPGSGPTDRNGNNGFGLKTDCYKLLAEGLALQNIASLRIDKRGVGKSKNTEPEEKLTLDSYINDVVQWTSLLQKGKKFKKIILMGHSEGALIATIAAQKISVGGVILISASGRPFDQLVEDQLNQNPMNPQQIKDESKAIMDSLKNGNPVKKVPPYLMALYRPSVQPFLISVLKYQPVKAVEKVKAPMLIIQGNADLQVKVIDADALANGNPKAGKVIIPNMNHVLKTVKDQSDNISTYSNPALPLAETLIPAITDFIRKRIS